MATTARLYPCFNGPVMICSIFWDSNEQIAFAQFLFNLSMISFSSVTICFAVAQREHSPAMLCALGQEQMPFPARIQPALAWASDLPLLSIPSHHSQLLFSCRLMTSTTGTGAQILVFLYSICRVQSLALYTNLNETLWTISKEKTMTNWTQKLFFPLQRNLPQLRSLARQRREDFIVSAYWTLFLSVYLLSSRNWF